MNKEEIAKIEQYFECYSDSPLHSYMWNRPLPARHFSHKEQSEFKLIVFTEDNAVYQGGSEADIIGVELRTFDELITRFESFTREKIQDIRVCES